MRCCEALFAGGLAIGLLCTAGCERTGTASTGPAADGGRHAMRPGAPTSGRAGTSGGADATADAGLGRDGGTGGHAGAGDNRGTGGNTQAAGTGDASAQAGMSQQDAGADDRKSADAGTSGNSAGSGMTGGSGTGASGMTGGSGTTGGSGMPGSGSTSGVGGNAGSGGSAIKPVTCATGGASSVCGNGVLDPGEQCDGADVRGLTCTALDPFFTSGTLACATNCTLDTTHCTHGTCGDGVIDPGEDCEPSTFDGNRTPCSSLLPAETDNALVQCTATTCRYDFSSCNAAPKAVCGNGKLETGEQCDGEARWVRTCVEYRLDYTGGALGCTSDCQLDISQCTMCDGTRCGDGIIGLGEQCDGDNLGSYTCADYNRAFGTVSCLSNCNVDYSQCYGGCTIYKGKIVSCN